MYSRLRLILSVILIGLFSVAHTQNVKLTGKVLNEKNEPLSGISIKIVGGGGTSTDIEGRFSLILSSGKKYDIQISAIGYAPKTLNETEVIAGQVNDLSITLLSRRKNQRKPSFNIS